MSENNHIRLNNLGDNDINSIESHQDLRKYIVKNSSEREIGVVSDLLYDIKSKKVRYLVISLTGKENSGREIIAPIGTVDYYELDSYLVISSLSENLIKKLPDYTKGQVNPGVENMVRLAFAGESEEANCSGLTGNTILNEGENFYSHFHFDVSWMQPKTEGSTKTVSAVFDDALEAENSISELLSYGFSINNIELNSEYSDELNKEEKISGSLLSVKIFNDEQALKVAEILDKNGCLNVYEKTE